MLPKAVAPAYPRGTVGRRPDRSRQVAGRARIRLAAEFAAAPSVGIVAIGGAAPLLATRTLVVPLRVELHFLRQGCELA